MKLNVKQKYVTRDSTATLLNHRQSSVKTILSLQPDVFPTDLNKAEIMTIFMHSAFLKKPKAERHQHVNARLKGDDVEYASHTPPTQGLSSSESQS